LEYVPFAGLRSYDPAGTQFDIAQAHVANVREGYNQSGWEQPRWINHISLRAHDPSQVAEFYEKIFELKEAETYRDDGSICMTDGKVKLLLRPRDNSLYRGLREGLDHFGFKVDNLEQTKKRFGRIGGKRSADTERTFRRRQRQEERRRLSPLLSRPTLHRRPRRRDDRYF
jgi:catechol 2,3-dioxygenase-like lactoylglutathione lyase family enzyme